MGQEEHTFLSARCIRWCGEGLTVRQQGRKENGWATDRGEGQSREFSYFDFKGSLESTCEEPSKWTDERGKGGESDAVDLERVHPHRFLRRISEIKIKKCASLAFYS